MPVHSFPTRRSSDLARGAARAAAHSSPFLLRGDLREARRADEVGEDLRQAPEPRQHAPPFPAAPASHLGSSARRRAEASESCPVPTTDQVS